MSPMIRGIRDWINPLVVICGIVTGVTMVKDKVELTYQSQIRTESKLDKLVQDLQSIKTDVAVLYSKTENIDKIDPRLSVLESKMNIK